MDQPLYPHVDGWDVADFVESGATREQVFEYIRGNLWKPDDLLAWCRNHKATKLAANHTAKTEPRDVQPRHSQFIIERLTDRRMADFFKRNFGHQVSYDHTRGSWLIWNGKIWRYDETGEVFDFAKQSVDNLFKIAESVTDDEYRKKLTNFASKCEQRRGLLDTLDLVKSIDSVRTTHRDWDQQSMLFNCANGTYDLAADKFRPHDQADRLTKHSPATYNVDADCPFWLEFLMQIFDYDYELIGYLQRAVAYSMTASTDEQCIFFCHGRGSNGKSAFFEALQLLMGDYWQKQPSELVMVKYGGQAIPNDVARLPGARMVVCSELQEAHRFNEALIKDLTGQNQITARFLHKEYFSFYPSHKLWLYGNHKPIIRGTDPAIWRRINLIPFTVTIPPEKQLPMSELIERFRSELSGILNWAVDGYRAYQRVGLAVPGSVYDATQSYRLESDYIGMFLRDMCDIDESHGSDAKTQCADVYSTYKQWCDKNGERNISHIRFSKLMAERGFEKTVGTGHVYHWMRVKLKPLV